MNLRTLRRQLKRVRKLSYFDERRYAAAVARQDARRTVMWNDRCQVFFDEQDKLCEEKYGVPAAEPDELYLAKVDRARELLGESDSNAKCATDQDVIDDFLRQQGFPIDDPRAGRSYDELFERMMEARKAEMLGV